jgi:small subunit ribosomal protein S1
MSTHHVVRPSRSSLPARSCGSDHRSRPRPPADQPVDQAGRRGWRAGGEYREHFEVDAEGNWATSSDEVEAAWAEYQNADAGVAGETPAAVDATEAVDAVEPVEAVEVVEAGSAEG